MENSTYDIYANSICNDIPIETLKDFIMTFLIDASKDMGYDFDRTETPERIYYIISTHYNHLPLSIIASGFKRGALGQYGTGRLIPRTVFGWMGEINQYYLTKHNTRDNSQDNYTKFDDLHHFPLGAAIICKIDWYRKGMMDINDWDKISVKEIAKMIGEKRQPKMEYFGVKNRLDEN